MFDKLNLDGTYPCKVVLKGAILKNGDTEDLVFTAKFNRMDQQEVNTLTQAIWHWDQTRKAIAEGRLLPNAANGVTNVSDIDWAETLIGLIAFLAAGVTMCAIQTVTPLSTPKKKKTKCFELRAWRVPLLRHG